MHVFILEYLCAFCNLFGAITFLLREIRLYLIAVLGKYFSLEHQ